MRENGEGEETGSHAKLGFITKFKTLLSLGESSVFVIDGSQI